MTIARRALLAASLATRSSLAATPIAGTLPATAPWQTLPPTPPLPQARRTARVEVAGASLWFAEFGPERASPVLLLHGGLANANYWCLVAPLLATRHRIIAPDLRAHGRSQAKSGDRLTYRAFAQDACAVLDHLGLARAAVIGWSDGGIAALDLAVTAPSRVSRLFLVGVNANPDGLIPGGSHTRTFRQFTARTRQEYRILAPEPEGYDSLVRAMTRLWATEPRFSPADLARIACPTTIVHGVHDEIITLRHSATIAAAIPGARLVIQGGVSHFAMLQAPEPFARNALAALDPASDQKPRETPN